MAKWLGNVAKYKIGVISDTKMPLLPNAILLRLELDLEITTDPLFKGYQHHLKQAKT